MNDDAEQLLAAGRGLYHTRNFAEAEATLQKAIALDARRVDAWFMLGMTCRSLGRPSQAIDACRQAVRLDVGHAAAHNLLGILLAETGRSAEAIDEFERALAISPDNADTHFNLGLVFLREQRLDETIEAFRATIELRPEHADAQAMLRQCAPAAAPSPVAPGATKSLVGATIFAAPSEHDAEKSTDVQLDMVQQLFERGDFAAAEAACRQALRTSPLHQRATHDLGVILLALRRPNEAVVELQRAIDIVPANALSHYSMGCALLELKNNAEAVKHLQESLRLQPDFAAAHTSLGQILTTCRRFHEAEIHLRHALELQPSKALCYYNLGGILVRDGRFSDAEALYRRAVELMPDYAAAWDGLGCALAGRAQYAAAERCYDRALEIEPTSLTVRAGRSTVLLAQGRWLEAWPDYEYRFSTRELRDQQVTERPWRGEPLEGRTILLYADQALGDTLQSVRYVPLVAARGGRVLLSVQRSLLPLLAGLPIVEQLLDRSQPPPHFDVQAALMSLPGLFGTTPDNVPGKVPYLSADPALVDQWRSRIRAMVRGRGGEWERGRGEDMQRARHAEGENAPGTENPKSKIQNPKSLLVGIAWQGNNQFLPGLHRSIPLAAFEPLARLRSVQLISLQKGPGSEQVAQVPFAERIVDLSSTLDEESGPFMDTAAIMTQLDLVISCDTALAHLAGALAVPVWVALPAVAEWRWLLDRDDTPWYPTMRLFRQRGAGNWSEVFERIAATLQKKLPLPP